MLLHCYTATPLKPPHSYFFPPTFYRLPLHVPPPTVQKVPKVPKVPKAQKLV